MGKFKIAGIQINCVVGNEERNLLKAFEMIDKAVLQGAKLITYGNKVLWEEILN